MASHFLRTTIVVLAFLVAACAPYPGFNNTTNLTFTNVSEQTTPTQEPTAQPQDQFAAHLTYIEGDLIKLKTKAVDPDKDKVTLEFSSPFDSTGAWQTKVGDAGDYPVTITAKDSKGAEAVQKILVTIKYANRPPVIEGLESIDAKEGDTISLDYVISDPDGDQTIVSYSGWMKNKVYTTTYGDAGVHNVTITAEDGKVATKKVVTINVAHVNRPPVIILAQSSYETTELIPVVVQAKATDPDNDKVNITYGAPLDQDGTWDPQLDQAGDYEATITASDGQDSSTAVVKIHVNRANRPPVITVLNDDGIIHAKEGDLIDLNKALQITDPEKEAVTVSYTGWMTSSTYQSGYDDQGSHVVTITATDDHGNQVTKDVTIDVQDVNRPPVFTTPA